MSKLFFNLFLFFPIFSITAQNNLSKESISSNVIQINSINIREDDMSDLTPLIELIGDKRIVALGESSHGSGSDFKAKARLIRFLHEEMDFNVILWEAGIFDLSYFNKSLIKGENPEEIIKRGLYAHWGYSEEVKELFEYVAKENINGIPLEIAGFDLQISNEFSTTPKLIHDLIQFFNIKDKQILSSNVVNKLEDLYSEALRVSEYAQRIKRKDSASVQFATVYHDLAELSVELKTILDQNRLELLKIYSPRTISLVNQMLKSLNGMHEINEPLPGDAPRSREDFVRRWNHREIVNSKNIEFFAKEFYSDSRIIIWAHNAHIVEGYLTSDFSKFSEQPPKELAIRPSGSKIRALLGDDLFSIAFTAYQGSIRKINDPLSLENEISKIADVPKNSIEDILHSIELDYGIFPLRKTTGELNNWLNEKRLGRIDTEFLPPQLLYWPHVADALFFINNIEPFNLIKD